jgi:hypothetical protein
MFAFVGVLLAVYRMLDLGTEGFTVNVWVAARATAVHRTDAVVNRRSERSQTIGVMDKLLYGLIALLGATAALANPTAGKSPAPALTLMPCQLPEVKRPARCGSLQVGHTTAGYDDVGTR